MLFPHLLYLSSPTTFKKFAEFINYHNLFPPPLPNTHSLSSISHSFTPFSIPLEDPYTHRTLLHLLPSPAFIIWVLHQWTRQLFLFCVFDGMGIHFYYASCTNIYFHCISNFDCIVVKCEPPSIHATVYHTLPHVNRTQLCKKVERNILSLIFNFKLFFVVSISYIVIAFVNWELTFDHLKQYSVT